MGMFSLKAYAAVNLLKDSGFEENITGETTPRSYFVDASEVPAWSTSDPSNVIEIWYCPPGIGNGFTPGRPGGIEFNAHSGDWLAEINAHAPAILYQTVKAAPGALYKWGIWHMGRNGTDVMQVLLGTPTHDGSISEGTPLNPFESGAQVSSPLLSDNQDAWGPHMGYYTLPADFPESTMQFQMEAVSSNGGQTDSIQLSMGNIIDDAELYMIAEPFEKTIHVGEPEPTDEELADLINLDDEYACEIDQGTPFDGSVGRHDVTIDVKDADGNLIGTINSTFIVQSTLKVKYVDENGATLKDFPAVTYESPDVYTVTPPSGAISFNNTEYVYDKVYAGSDALTGTMDADRNVILVLKPQSSTISAAAGDAENTGAELPAAGNSNTLNYVFLCLIAGIALTSGAIRHEAHKSNMK